mmetsp:Transcript_111883/g.349971  ORF Transcript_111883/g.349971 Transcript_111883/m.349971 type:complete len:110 (+) Transcript_111883:77-406(+)
MSHSFLTMPTTLAELRRDLCWTLVFAAIALLLPAIWAVRIARQFPGTKSEAELLEELGVDTAQPKAAKQQQQQQQTAAWARTAQARSVPLTPRRRAPVPRSARVRRRST